ncbi:MAG: sodium:proton antiporter [Ruminococcaceae bacterium]|nr:sodium:proton antiporter [Oscillospiraceae bacterium]
MNTATVFISLAIALLAGLLLSRLAKLVHLPAVTAYLVAGILIGPFALGALGLEGIGFSTLHEVEGYSILCDLALGFIAFAIGNEFRMSQLKLIGKQATVIGILQAVVTTILVDIVLIGLHFAMPDVLPLPVAIVLGAVAAATAPAATLMVVKQYKAKGPLTSILLPIVALDDAVGLVLFAVSFGVAKSIGAGNISLLSVLLEPILEVILSILLGFVMGLLFNFMERFFHSRSKRLAVSVAFVLITVGISSLTFTVGGIHIAFSSLLSCMMLGTVFCNVCDFSEELMDRVDRWTAPLFILFFVLSGAELNLGVFKSPIIVLIGIVYIIARSLGKYSGAYSSAKMMKCDDNIVKYLGITLLPQAGVALGMASKASSATVGIPGGDLVLNITLFAVLVYEIVGPFLTKISLSKAGEIEPEGRVSARHEHAEKMGINIKKT